MTIKTFALTFLTFLLIIVAIWFAFGFVGFSMESSGRDGWLLTVCVVVCRVLAFSAGFWERLVGWQGASYIALATTALTLTMLLQGGRWWRLQRRGRSSAD